MPDPQPKKTLHLRYGLTETTYCGKIIGESSPAVFGELKTGERICSRCMAQKAVDNAVTQDSMKDLKKGRRG